MKWMDFLKDKLLYVLFCAGAAIAAAVLMLALGLGLYTVVFLSGLYLISAAAALTLEFFQKRSFYLRLQRMRSQLDKKYLLSEMLDDPDFLEGGILVDVLTECNKSMNDEIAKYRIEQQDYREYIETWVHEVKTPLASAYLILDNRPAALSGGLRNELGRVERFVDQALFYARSGGAEKDYVIRKATLREIAASALKKEARMLIEAHTAVEQIELDFSVYTDIKWTDFILGQIFSNSVKYGGTGLCLRLTGIGRENGVSLLIEDNGRGIPAQDLPRVFEKGFTGSNGRTGRKSTGIGLYLCKKLCDKLGLGIFLTSVEGKGVAVELVFPINKMLELSDT